MNHTWKHVAAFFVLTVLLLGLVPLLSVLTGASMDFDAVASRATEKTGIEQTSNLVTLIRLSIAEPGLLLLVLGAAVPSLAAVVVVAASRPGDLRYLARRFRPLGEGKAWDAGLRAYGAIFVLYRVGIMAVYGVRWILPGPEYTQPPDLLGPALILALLTAAFLDQGALLEELGWRGYAQNEMQRGGLTPLAVAVIIGVAWGVWHVPRDVFAGVIERLGAFQYLFIYLPSFVLGTLSMSVIAAYFVNRCGGSVWPAIVVHGLGNDAVGISGLASITQALTPYHQITKAVPFAIAAIVIVLLAGRALGRDHSEAES